MGEIMEDLLKFLHTPWEFSLILSVICALQILLTLCGNCRKHIPGFCVRLTVWFAYSLIGSFVKVSMGKLTTVKKHGPGPDNKNTTAIPLLASLLLVQLGNPDTITAYSIEDNKLGLRQVLSLIFQVGTLLNIFVRWWTSYLALLFFLPTFLVGIIKYGELLWALKSARRNSSLNSEEINQHENVPTLFAKLPVEIPNLELILKAYYRFDCLKPHLENLYEPFYESLPWMSIDAYSPKDMFKIIDVELGFMYDVFYTKAPIIYTRTGCLLRIISFFCLVSALSEFSFNEHIFYKKGNIYIFVLLLTTIVLEVYQIMLLPFSDWAIIQMIRHHNKPIIKQCLQLLGPKSYKWRRWSNSLGQFNLLSFCLHDRYLKFNRIIKPYGINMDFRKVMNKKRTKLPKELKELILQELKEVVQVRGSKPINQRGQWALDRYGCLNQLKWSVKRGYDKSIVIWHIATAICYYSDVQHNTMDSKIEMSKLLSNYLMYLLTFRPHMLCITTADVIFYHAYTKLMKFLRTGSTIIRNEQNACRTLRSEELEPESDTEKGVEIIVTSKWHVLHDAQRLARDLMDRENRWHIISSVWVEMLCYGASNCPMDHHAEQLRRGGGLITHVWLLLAHKTEKFSTNEE